METTKTLQGLANFVNENEDWLWDIEDIIEDNGWASDTHEDFGVCHNDEGKVYLNDHGKAVVKYFNQ